MVLNEQLALFQVISLKFFHLHTYENGTKMIKKL